MKYRGGLKVASLALFIALASSFIGSAASYDSMVSYEELLRSQTLLMGSFENLLKNTTLKLDDQSNFTYTFLDSFDDLAERQQRGLYSFEDVVTFNWSTLTDGEKVNLTTSFEDLLRRQAIILESNEDLLKRGFCDMNSSQQQDLLDRFEDRLNYEVVLYEKFEDWLHYQQMMEDDEYETWIAFLASFEDLIRRQANLLDSFEMLMKIRCDTTYLELVKVYSYEVENESVNYSFNVTAGTNDVQNITIVDSILGTIVEDISLEAGAFSNTSVGPIELSCADCNNCTCKVCNFATACGEVITPYGNFTVCVVSDQACPVIDDYPESPEYIYPGLKIEEEAIVENTVAENAVAEDTVALEKSSNVSKPCPTCSKNS